MFKDLVRIGIKILSNNYGFLGGVGKAIKGTVSTLGRVTGLSKGNAYKISANQKKLQKLLLDRAMGKGQSVAELQYKQALQEGQRKLMGALASQRTRNVGLARREALQAGASLMQDQAQQGAILRNQEQQNALNAAVGFEGAQQQARLGAEQNQTQAFGNLLGAGSQVGAAFATSDEKVKKDVKPGKSDIKAFLDAISAKSFKYKSEANEDNKEHAGVMAQDLEKTKAGKGMVEESPEGIKQIDFGKGFNTMLASMAELNDRLKKVEKDPDIEKLIKKHLSKKRGA